VTTLVLGLGNPIRGDDAVGLRVAEAVRRSLPPGADVEVDTCTLGGLRLMERLVGYDRAVLVDAILTGAHPPGTVLRLGLDDVATQNTASSHDVNLPTALRLAADLGLRVPAEIPIVAVEVENVLDFAEGCGPEVEAAVPRAAAAVREECDRYKETP
jgi:hydrogenase maturation protease